MHAGNVRKCYEINAKKEATHLLLKSSQETKRNCRERKVDGDLNGKHQRKIFENLTNQITAFEHVPSSASVDEESCGQPKGLSASKKETAAAESLNLQTEVKSCEELQLKGSLQKKKPRKVFRLRINASEKPKANPLKAITSELRVVLNRVDEVSRNKLKRLATDSNVASKSKASLAKRKRKRNVSQTSPKKAKQSIITARSQHKSDGAPHKDELPATVKASAKVKGKAAVKRLQIATRKGTRNMSLYERRYQAEDSRGQQGVVSNGFVGSSRNASATSSSIHSDPDLSNQYNMAASSGTSVLSASGTVNGSAPSMATLCNIGNTCYLNSVVYTLRFAPKFVHNLHHLIADLSIIQQNIGKHRANKSSSLGRNVSGAQMENARSWSSKDLASFENSNANAISSGSEVESPKTSQQLLTEKLHELYQNLHRNEMAESAEPFHADILLQAIQDVSSVFEGNQQQDAHEFLMCVLNSIRDTCQILIKAIADYPDVLLDNSTACNDQVDSRTNVAMDKESRSQSNQNLGVGVGGGSNLSTTSVTKTSFFSRKSKRKEESKSSKNQRLQSPLKETSQSQTVSNSLFYLNTVDLSAANGKQQQTNSRNSHANANNATAAATLLNNSIKLKTEQQQSGNDVESPTLKDKQYLSEKIRQLGLDFFRDDFEGITVSTTKCLSCETVTKHKEIMIDIAVPVPISGFDNTDHMDKSTSFIQNSCITREYFRGENKYRCEQCTGYTEAIRCISYEVLPRLLVIQLSRFSGGMEKINSYIPTSFMLPCFCEKCCMLNDDNKLHIYKLYSVITHVGATMSVGHYIAYTCCLDWANEYVNCPKDVRGSQQFGSGGSLQSATTCNLNAAAGVNSMSTTSVQSSAASAAASALASSGTSLMKKMKFGRSKASSSGDMSKSVKNVNGLTSRTITNGIGQLSMNATCHSVRCCAARLGATNDALTSCSTQHLATNAANVNNSSGLYLSNNGDLIDDNLPNGSGLNSNNSSTNFNYASSGYGSTGRSTASKAAHSASSPPSSTAAEPIWYMCDDDKIKAMTQREFEELLSPSRKITITPYLLFYTRIDSQAAAPHPPTKQAHAQPGAWSSNDGVFLQRVQMDKM